MSSVTDVSGIGEIVMGIKVISYVVNDESKRTKIGLDTEGVKREAPLLLNDNNLDVECLSVLLLDALKIEKRKREELERKVKDLEGLLSNIIAG